MSPSTGRRAHLADQPVVVDDGIGCATSSKTQIFNDKEWIVTDNNPISQFYGRTYVTWTRVRRAQRRLRVVGDLRSRTTTAAAALTGPRPQEISGSNAALCYVPDGGGPAARCDEDQFSSADRWPRTAPSTSPSRTSQNTALWEPGEFFDNQYLLVKSTDGGEHWSNPSFVVGLEDGSNDYPINVPTAGRRSPATRCGVNSAGNIVASRTTGTLYSSFDGQPRTASTTSANPVDEHRRLRDELSTTAASSGRRRHSSIGAGRPTMVPVGARSTQPAAAIGDRLPRPRRLEQRACYTTAHRGGHAGIRLVKTTMNTAPSNPAHSIYFQARNAGVATKCATFHGDYINISYGSDGHANVDVDRHARVSARGPQADGGSRRRIFFARK